MPVDDQKPRCTGTLTHEYIVCSIYVFPSAIVKRGLSIGDHRFASVHSMIRMISCVEASAVRSLDTQIYLRF